VTHEHPDRVTPTSMPSSRLAALLDAVQDVGADALVVSFLPDIRWATGFTGSNGLVVILPDAAHLVTDGRYAEQARAEASGVAVHAPGYDLIGFVAAQGWLLPGLRVAVQADHVAVATMRAWRLAFPGVEWVETAGLAEPIVAVKTDAEVAQIVAAQRITESVFEDVCGLIRPGVTEQELAAEIVVRHLRRGCERMAFDPIVASGPNGARPHQRPTDREMRRGDAVVLDMGGVLGGYASDMTRTVFVGEASVEQRHVYGVVLEAQEAAVRAARGGMTGAALDGIARSVIARHHYGEHFAHGLGHGIGLQTHEWPRVSYTNAEPLPVGACVTVEPGVYLEGRFGVRIEDIVHLHGDGCTNLTRADKALRVL